MPAIFLRYLFFDRHAYDLKTYLEMGDIFLLFRRQMQDLLLTVGAVLEDVALDIQILPTDENLDRSHLQRLEGVLHAEAVLAGVLGDLVEVPPYQLFLLNELDVGQALGRQLDGLQRRHRQ